MARLDNASIHYKAVRDELDARLDRLVAAHQAFMAADEKDVDDAYVARWELLNELEEFLADACTELAP
jgi:hypothetical protein